MMEARRSSAMAQQPQLLTSPLRARVITTLDEWRQLADIWDRLLVQSQDATPWQSWSFLSNWWMNLATRHSLFVIVVEQHGTPCMVMPLQLTSARMLGLRVRALEPIGMWSDVNRPRLALGIDTDEAYDCAFNFIWELRSRWQLLRVDEKLLDDAEVKQLQRFCANKNLLFRSIFSHLCPYLDLRQRWQQFLEQRSSKFRKNLRASRRRLESLGTVTVRDCRTVDEISRAFEVVLALHQHSWKRHKRVEHTSAAYRQFFKRWLLDMANTGGARILLLYCETKPVAATIGFLYGHTYFSAQIVHDEAFDHCSPGTLLESIEIEGLMSERQFTRYDFLGSFLNNKLRWTDTAHSTSVVYAMQPTLKNKLIAFHYFKAKPRIKQYLNTLKSKIHELRSGTGNRTSQRSRALR